MAEVTLPVGTKNVTILLKDLKKNKPEALELFWKHVNISNSRLLKAKFGAGAISECTFGKAANRRGQLTIMQVK